MTKPRDISKGDWIKDGRHNGEVTEYPNEPETDYFLITWGRGAESGVLGRNAKKDVRRVYKARRKW